MLIAAQILILFNVKLYHLEKKSIFLCVLGLNLKLDQYSDTGSLLYREIWVYLCVMENLSSSP